MSIQLTFSHKMEALGLCTTPKLRVLALLISAVPRASAYTPWNLESDYFTSTLVGGNMGDLDGRQTNALFNRPDGLAIDEQAQELYIADRGNHRIRRVRIGHPDASDYVTTFVGWYQGFADGFGTNARFDEPISLAVDGYTRLLFVADSANMVIRQVDLNTARVTTLAGSPGVQGFVNGRGGAAAFSRPAGLALALHSRQLFVCDPYNHAVRVVNVVTREVRTLAGSGLEGSADGRGEIASFKLPHAVAVDADERTVYVAERSPRVRAIETAYEPASTTTVSTGGGSRAAVALTTGVALGHRRARAQERLSQRMRRERLTDAVGAAEQVGVVDPVAGERALQRLDSLDLTLNLGQRHGRPRETRGLRTCIARSS